MPCHGTPARYEGRAWCDHLAATERAMVAAGWIKRSLKFHTVALKKAKKTFAC